MNGNLPPGCSISDIPGNRPEDFAYEAFMDWLDDTLQKSGLDMDECKRAVLIGVAAVEAERECVKALIQERIGEERMAWDHEHDKLIERAYKDNP